VSSQNDAKCGEENLRGVAPVKNSGCLYVARGLQRDMQLNISALLLPSQPRVRGISSFAWAVAGKAPHQPAGGLG